MRVALCCLLMSVAAWAEPSPVFSAVPGGLAPARLQVAAEEQGVAGDASASEEKPTHGAAREAEGLLSPINTDRPHVSEAASVVGPATFQLETGMLLETGDRQRPGFSLPVLLRAGLSDEAELRLESESLPNLQGGGGARDLNLGAKVMLFEAETVSAAVLLRVGVYTGSERFAAHLEPGAKLLVGVELNDSLGMEVNLGLTSVFDGATSLQPNFATALTQELDEHWSVFGEVFGYGVRREPFALYGQSGVIWASGPNKQWDLEIIRGLTPGTQEWGFGLGYSQRF